MDFKQIVSTTETLAQDLIENTEGSMPPVLPKTPNGKAGYDRVIDALNRLPRPLMALGTLAVFVAAAVNPVWFEGRMQVLAAVPQPLWWLLGAVLTLFFGGREAHYMRTIGTPKG